MSVKLSFFMFFYHLVNTAYLEYYSEKGLFEHFEYRMLKFHNHEDVINQFGWPRSSFE